VKFSSNPHIIQILTTDIRKIFNFHEYQLEEKKKIEKKFGKEPVERIQEKNL